MSLSFRRKFIAPYISFFSLIPNPSGASPETPCPLRSNVKTEKPIYFHPINQLPNPNPHQKNPSKKSHPPPKIPKQLK